MFWRRKCSLTSTHQKEIVYLFDKLILTQQCLTLCDQPFVSGLRCNIIVLTPSVHDAGRIKAGGLGAGVWLGDNLEEQGPGKAGEAIYGDAWLGWLFHLQ